jgi:hypothetical protein
MKFKTCSDAIVYECWAINKYKPKWNKQSKKNDALTINIDVEEKWKLYKEIRPVKPIKYESTGFIWKTIAFIYALGMVLKLLGFI